MSKNWINNVELLNSIIDDLIIEEKITDNNFKQSIYLFYESELAKAYKNQLNYKNYNIMNKEIIKNIVDYIDFKKTQMYEIQKKEQIQLKHQQNQMQNQQKYQNNKNQEIEEVYTREDIHDKRTQVFSSEYEKRKKEFEDSIVLKPPEDIDFTDKTEIPNTSIDELMEEEIKRRGYEINNEFNMSKEEAEKWIYGESGKPNIKSGSEYKSQQHTNNNSVKSVRFNDVDTIDTIEEKQDINTEPSFLSKLKKIQDKKRVIQQAYVQQVDVQQEQLREQLREQPEQPQEQPEQQQEPNDTLQLDIQEINNKTNENIKNEILQHIQKTIMCDNENIWFELNNTINNYDINIVYSKNKCKIMFSKTQ
jgi:hypothetical protein